MLISSAPWASGSLPFEDSCTSAPHTGAEENWGEI